MYRRAPLWPASVLLLGCALVSGCGSSSTSSSTSASSTNTQTASALSAPRTVAARELARLPQLAPPATAILGSPSKTKTVDRRYLTRIFDDVQSVWRREFVAAHAAYQPARLVFFWDKVRSGCGHHEDSGPFYCPTDRTIYLDLRFFTALLRRAAVGAAAQAYLIGHEFGHQVQQLLGIAHAVAVANGAQPSGHNARSVKVELEADCLAGAWASSAYPRSDLSVNDLYDGLRTAEVIGDDYLAQAAGQVVDSSMWTHGSSQQRQAWLRTGFRSGRPNSCDTFAAG
jgi:uncharacterized protein